MRSVYEFVSKITDYEPLVYDEACERAVLGQVSRRAVIFETLQKLLDKVQRIVETIQNSNRPELINAVYETLIEIIRDIRETVEAL